MRTALPRHRPFPEQPACLLFLALLLAACSPRAPEAPRGSATPPPDPRLLRALAALEAAAPELGPEAAASIRARLEAAPEPFFELLAQVETERAADPARFRRVDKLAPPLAPTDEPGDLLPLDGSGLSLSRSGHRLRKATVEALLAMDRAARAEGILLLVSSTYRSFDYQKVALARAIESDGEEAARKLVAEPGRSQHQLGTALDFGSIDASFGSTAAAAWLTKRAGEFGFSLSYPEGQEAVTGYAGESWHYRYLGQAACRLQAEYFSGLQQSFLLFLERCT